LDDEQKYDAIAGESAGMREEGHSAMLRHPDAHRGVDGPEGDSL
jgi:hypothetical protein